MELRVGSGYTGEMDKHPKRPRDPSQLAKLMIDIASGEASELAAASGKDPNAVMRGKAGGEKRAAKLSPSDRRLIAQKAAKTRWQK